MQARNSGTQRPPELAPGSPTLAPLSGRCRNCRETEREGAGEQPTHCLHLTPTEIHFACGGGPSADPNAGERAGTVSAGVTTRAAATEKPADVDADDITVAASDTTISLVCPHLWWACLQPSPKKTQERENTSAYECQSGYHPASFVPSRVIATSILAGGPQHVVTMPRNRGGPAAAASPSAGAGARRRQAFAGKGHSVSLDSAEGVSACVPQQREAAEVSVGRGASHRSGSRSEGEEEATKQPASSAPRRAGKFSRGKRGKASQPTQSTPAEEKQPQERATSPKTKSRRVDRLREFTERLRHTDLKWSRDDRPPPPTSAPMSAPPRPPPPAPSPAGSPPTSDLPPSQPPRRRRKPKPPRPPPISENVPAETLPAPKTPIYKTYSAPHSETVTKRPLSDGYEGAVLTGKSPVNAVDYKATTVSPVSSPEPVSPPTGRMAGVESERRVSAGSAESYVSAEKHDSRKEPRSPSAGRATPDYYSQPRTIPFRSASFSRSHSSSIGRSGRQGAKSAIKIEPVYFSINKPPASSASASQTLPKKFKTHGAAAQLPEEPEPDLRAVHVRHNSDSLVEWANSEPAEDQSQSATEAPAKSEASQRDSLLLDALLKEINQGTSGFLGHEPSADDVVSPARRTSAPESSASRATTDDWPTAATPTETVGNALHAAENASGVPPPAENTHQAPANEPPTPSSDAVDGSVAAADDPSDAAEMATTATAADAADGVDGGDQAEPGPTAVSYQPCENKPNADVKSGDSDRPELAGQEKQSEEAGSHGGNQGAAPCSDRPFPGAGDPACEPSNPATRLTGDSQGDSDPQELQHPSNEDVNSSHPAETLVGVLTNLAADSNSASVDSSKSSADSRNSSEQVKEEGASTVTSRDPEKEATLEPGTTQKSDELSKPPVIATVPAPTTTSTGSTSALASDNDVYESQLRLQQAQVDVLTTKLDQLDEEPEAVSQIHENFKQAVKMAVETLLSEVSAGDEPTELATLPSGAIRDREVARVRVEGKEIGADEWDEDEELTTTFTSTQKKKKASSDDLMPPLLDLHGVVESSSTVKETKTLTFERRFKSKSLSPIPFQYREELMPVVREELPETLEPSLARSGTRGKSRSLEHKQRSFDLLDHPSKEPIGKERKRSLKRKKGEAASLSHVPSHDSLSSSSSDEMRGGARGQGFDKDYTRQKSDKPRPKPHTARGRTTSDATTLRPLLSHQPAGMDMLNLEDQTNFRHGRRHASPSFWSYDSDVEKFPRSPHGPRRRLRGPYGEMLEGKMSRGESYRSMLRTGDDVPPKMLASLAESGSPSPSPGGSSPRTTRPQRASAEDTEDAEDAAPPPSRAHLGVSSDSELVELDPAAGGHVRAVSSPSELAHYQELLSSEEYYDGVGPTAESLISQLSLAEVGQMRAQPRKRGRRLFIIGELLDTEQSYVDSLRLLLTYYRKLREPELGALIDPNTLLDIFHMVPEILEIHEDFLRELVNRAEHWSSEQRIGEVFLDKLTPASVLETYTAFVNNWLPAREALRRACQMKPGLAKFLENLERSNKRKLSFTHLFIGPVQRIPRYELLLKQLVSHTATDHPDLPALRQALSEVHQLAARINSLEQETMQNEALQQTLREVEAAVDGLEGIVAPDRILVRHDQVTMTTALGTKKERMLFLFNDLLVIASIKRRAGATRKPHSLLTDGSMTGLDANKYKLLMKIPLADLSIARSKDENLSSLLKEVEKIEEDISTLRQIGVMVCKLHCNHYQVEELVKEMANVLNKQLSERHRADSQLMLLQLSVTTQEGIENISMNFFEVEKRTAWEQVFNETKQKLALAADRRPVPEFLYPLPIRKTRAGLQFTCAAATLSLNQQHMRDVWVCNSDGYVGHICLLSLRPEPTVTSCNGVCNSRILCIAPVPSVQGRTTARQCTPTSSNGPERRSNEGAKVSEREDGLRECDDEGTNIDLDSSSDSFDSDDSHPEDSTRPDAAAEMPNRGSQQDQPTMWLGTEDGCIYVYNCNEYIRIKKTKVKVQLGSAVHSIVYLDGRVFVALANGTVSAYSKAEGSSWDMQSPEVIQVSSAAVNRLVVVSGKLWACSLNRIRVIEPSTNSIEHTVTVSSDTQTTIQALVPSGLGVWLCFSNMGTVRLFHAVNFEMICEVDVTSAVTRMLSGCDDIIRQHKTACLRVTSLMVCKDLLWIGTSAGVILNLPLPPLTSTTSWLTNTLSIAGISHGHTGHVRFLASVEATVEVAAPTRYRHSRGAAKVKEKPAHKGAAAGRMLVISGGDGYEDFRSSASELSGRDDSTNHLLLWRV